MKTNIKEIYNQICIWLAKQDSKKIKFLKEQSCYDNSSEIWKLQQTLSYYDTIDNAKENMKYIFGEEKVTLKEIGKYMIESMGNYGPDKGESKADFDEDSEHSGYATIADFKEIKDFWENFDEDALMSIANGTTMDDYEIDLNGYRCYFLSHSNVHPLIFNYIYYTLNKTPEELEEELWNSNESFEEISYLYPPKELFLPGKDVINKLYAEKSGEKKEENLENFNDSIEDILNNENFKKEPELKSKLAELKSLLKR